MTKWETFTLKIWRSRPHQCECCEAFLPFPIRTFYFSHILGKGAWPRFKWLEQNIQLMCFICHQHWDAGDKSQEKFKITRLLESQLIHDYSAETQRG
jgi:hypothetical protein